MSAVLRTLRSCVIAACHVRPKVPGSGSARTVVTMSVALSAALDDAMRQGPVTRNVARLVKRAAIGHHEMAMWIPKDHGRGDGQVARPRPRDHVAGCTDASTTMRWPPAGDALLARSHAADSR